MTKKKAKTKDTAKQQISLLNDKSSAGKIYHKMLLIRRFEERAGQLYGMGLIGGFCHLYIGQEAVVTGILAAKEDGDSIITSYRDHGHMLACDIEAGPIMAELTGRIGGTSKGKGGSMHMFDIPKGFYGGHGIVGAQVSIGNGLAFAHKYRQDNGLCYTFYGEGAANQGQVYESFNMAALWKLPILFVLENNRYAMGTSVERSTAKDRYYQRGEALGVPGTTVDGQDVDEVYQVAKSLSDEIRSGSGPRILEVKTYRYRGHSMSDPAKYRAKKEVDEYRQHHDPITAWREKITPDLLSEDELKAIDVAVKSEIDKAIAFAKESPEPNTDELWTDVYSSPVMTNPDITVSGG